nr:hypothetical protein [Tanacetum cinerariifolium]
MVAKFEVQELEINSLKARIKVLEDKDRGVSERYGDDAPIKGRSGVAKVPTGSGSIPTAGPPATEVPPGSDVVPTVEIARIHDEEELQIMIHGLDMSNETVAKYLQEYHQFATELPIERRI